MATGSIGGSSKRNYSKPVKPSTVTATTSTTTTDVTISITPTTTIGPKAGSYTIAGTATANNAEGQGVSTSRTVTGTTTTMTDVVTALSGGATYSFVVTPNNFNGPSDSTQVTTLTGVMPPADYTGITSTITSSGTYTIPAGKTRMTAIITGGGSAGNANDRTGGSGAGIAAAKDISVTAGTTWTITVASQGGQTILTSPNSVDVLTANGGSGQNSGGSGSTNLNSGTFTSNGGAGGSAGNNGAWNQNNPAASPAQVGSSGVAPNPTTPYVLNALGLTNLSFTMGGGGGGGGGGGQGRIFNESGSSQGGAAGGSGVMGGGAGGGGQTGSNGNTNSQSAPGSAGTSGTGGGGGGPGGAGTTVQGNNAGSNLGAAGAGASGSVVLYLA